MEIPQELAKLDRARLLLAEAATLPEIKQIRDMAKAAEVYAKAAHMSREAVNYAGEIKLLADRKAGELLKQLERGQTGPKKLGARAAPNSDPHGKLPDTLSGNSDYRRVLEDSKTSERTAERWQKLAAIPEAKVRDYLAAVHDSDDAEVSTRGLLKAANGHHKKSAEDDDRPPFNEIAEAGQFLRGVRRLFHSLWPAGHDPRPIIAALRSYADALEKGIKP